MTKMANKKPYLNNSVLVAAMLLAVLFLGGCSQRNGGSAIPEVYTGTAGVDVTFAPEGVPEVMTEGSPSDAVLFITNKGAVDVDISDVIIKVNDDSASVGFGSENKGVMVIDGAGLAGMLTDPAAIASGKLFGKASNTIGSLDSIKVEVTAKNLPGKDAVDTGLLSTVCYKYETRLTANVCVDASPFSFQKQRKPCDAKLPLSFQSQGAPVAVKRIDTLDPEKSGGFVKPKFKIYFANVGNGLVIDNDSLNLFCTDKDPGKTDDKVRIVWVDSVMLNDKLLTCNNQRPIQLTGKLENDFVLCSYTANDFADGSGTFATPLKIQLSYGYRSTSDPIPVRVENGVQCNAGSEVSCKTTKGETGTQKCISGHWTYCQK